MVCRGVMFIQEGCDSGLTTGQLATETTWFQICKRLHGVRLFKRLSTPLLNNSLLLQVSECMNENREYEKKSWAKKFEEENEKSRLILPFKEKGKERIKSENVKTWGWEWLCHQTNSICLSWLNSRGVKFPR